MSLSSDQKPASADKSTPTADADGAYAAWGLLILGAIGAVPALVWGGRVYAVPLIAATAGWFVGALIDRSRR